MLAVAVGLAANAISRDSIGLAAHPGGATLAPPAAATRTTRATTQEPRKPRHRKRRRRTPTVTAPAPVPAPAPTITTPAPAPVPRPRPPRRPPRTTDDSGDGRARRGSDD